VGGRGAAGADKDWHGSEQTNAGLPAMMKRETFAIGNIYVPVKRRATLDPKKAQQIAESILQVGLQSPILVRQDGERLVLLEGLHRLEACKQLGEETIVGYVVQARRH
jgi:sulfiredoxin